LIVAPFMSVFDFMNLSFPWNALSLAALALVVSLVLGRLVVSLPRRIDASLNVHFPLVQRLTFSAICTVLGAVCGWRYGLTLVGVSIICLVLLLVTLGWTDALSGLLPDVLTLSTLWLGLLVSVNHTLIAPADAIIGAAAGYGFFWLLNRMFWLLIRRESLGCGDLKLLAAIGAWLGWEPLMMVVALASVLGVVMTALRRWWLGQSLSSALYFGPYLALAGIVQLLLEFKGD